MSIGFTQYIRGKVHWDLRSSDDLYKLDAIRLIKSYHKEFFPEFANATFSDFRAIDIDDLRLLLVRVSKTHILPVPPGFYTGRI